MQGIQPYEHNPLLSSRSSVHGFHLDLTSLSSTSTTSSTTSLTIDAAEPVEDRINRMVSENPVVIFCRSSSCCMCHVVRQLLSNLGVHPTIIELDENEIGAVATALSDSVATLTTDDEEEIKRRSGYCYRDRSPVPEIFIGGTRVGGVESVVALHLRGQLLPLLAKAGAPMVDRTFNLFN